MEEHAVSAAQPTPGTLIDQIYDPADYRDAFRLKVPAGSFATVESLASAYFENQPRWLSLLSMNLTSRAKLIEALGDHSYPVGSSIGSWQVHDRSGDEIVFGDDMGFMEYRFSLRIVAGGTVEASTAVRYPWRRSGRFYFAAVRPMHRRFVPLSLRAVA